MHSFRDNAGRTWMVNIHVTAVKQVKGLLGVNLYGLIDNGLKGLGELISDPVALVDVVYVLCKPDADKLGITDEDFGRAMAGDAIEEASIAFLAELTDFFQNPRIRAGIRKLLETSDAVRNRLMDQLDKQIATIDPDAEALKLIASFGNAPESSDSTPDPSPSASSSP